MPRGGKQIIYPLFPSVRVYDPINGDYKSPSLCPRISNIREDGGELRCMYAREKEQGSPCHLLANPQGGREERSLERLEKAGVLS